MDQGYYPDLWVLGRLPTDSGRGKPYLTTFLSSSVPVAFMTPTAQRSRVATVRWWGDEAIGAGIGTGDLVSVDR